MCASKQIAMSWVACACNAAPAAAVDTAGSEKLLWSVLASGDLEKKSGRAGAASFGDGARVFDEHESIFSISFVIYLHSSSGASAISC